MDGVTYQREAVTASFNKEVKPLLYQHWHESEIYGAEVEPDWLAYAALQDREIFYLYTIRIFGELVGYSGYIVSPSYHSREQIVAQNDLCYVVPKERGKSYFVNLIKFAEEDLKAKGVNVIGLSVKVDHDFSNILIRQGFVLEEHYYSKEVQ